MNEFRQWRWCLIGSVLLTLTRLGSSAYAGEARFDFAVAKKQAEVLAKRPYQPGPPLPDALQGLTYDRYRLIAFRHERALWRDAKLPFWLELYHRGFVARDTMDIALIEDGVARPLAFDPALFQYRGEIASMKPERSWGYSGYRLLCRLPTRPNYQEFCSFQGASYFRAVCTDQVYGASARGLAIDIGMTKAEEFPVFRKMWIERPAADARMMRAWALLEGPSVAGAYEFVIRPGRKQTTIDIDCQLFFRKAVEKVGIAPMSSMWSNAQAHDSDGLLIHAANGEWVWRPLSRQGPATVSRHQFDGIKGFGLLQRDRDSAHYRKDGADYQRRPGVWITPRATWGAGAVELLEANSDVEWVDNIAAWWGPKKPVQRGDALNLSYRVAFAADDPADHRGGRFVHTKIEPAGQDRRFTLTLDSEALRKLAADTELQPVITTSRGRIVDASCAKSPDGTWQVRFGLARHGRSTL